MGLTDTRTGRFVAHALLMIVPVLGMLGIAELVAWAVGTVPLSEDRTFQGLERARDCAAAPNVIEAVCDPERFVRAGGRRAVYVLGGSSVQGYPDDVTPFATFLGHWLEQRRPGAYQVHNLGRACRDSTFVRKCAERVGESGDVYVIYAGHNDFMNYMVPNPRLRMASIEYPGLFSWESWLATSHLYSALFTASIDMAEQAEPKGERERLSESEWQQAHRLTIEHYAENLERLLARAREREIDVWIATVLSNVSEFPHRRDAWDARLARSEERTAWDVEYERGIRLLRSGRTREALAAFRAARDENLWGRAPTELNQRIRRMAEADPNARLVDLEVELGRVWGPGQHGCDWFGGKDWCDQFHPNDRLNQLIARSVGRTLMNPR